MVSVFIGFAHSKINTESALKLNSAWRALALARALDAIPLFVFQLESNGFS